MHLVAFSKLIHFSMGKTWPPLQSSSTTSALCEKAMGSSHKVEKSRATQDSYWISHFYHQHLPIITKIPNNPFFTWRLASLAGENPWAKTKALRMPLQLKRSGRISLFRMASSRPIEAALGRCCPTHQVSLHRSKQQADRQFVQPIINCE